jgi:DNA-binding transcriptional LysR family regulator
VDTPDVRLSGTPGSGAAIPHCRPAAARDVVESLSLLTNLGLLMETPRIALMPSVAANQFARAGLLRVLDLPETCAFGTVGFSVRSNKEQSAAGRAFIACLREAAQASVPDVPDVPLPC